MSGAVLLRSSTGSRPGYGSLGDTLTSSAWSGWVGMTVSKSAARSSSRPAPPSVSGTFIISPVGCAVPVASVRRKSYELVHGLLGLVEWG